MNDKIGALKSLTERFEANYAQYMSASYDEANMRADFIDRLFELLGWDVRNEQGFSEMYRDVVREDKVLINGQMKAPDYSFRVGGTVKFYVEAKRPSVHIRDNADTAYQVRRYAWTKKLPLSILSDFEEFTVYDTRIKPNPRDSASVARIFYCTFREYERHFDFIYSTFSKNAILKGSFDRYAEENKNKKGTSEVDSELLSLVEAWRVELAKNIALRNGGIGIYSLNTAVQKIIDRIMFLRIAEDKGIEDADSLKGAAQGKNIYGQLNRLFGRAHTKYNSGLFKAEKWIEDLAIDDKVLQSIVANLYYPLSPYEFSVLPIEILGNIYEKFLGKTIYFRGVKSTADGVRQHTAVIEEKPEVRKAGGVYYTPQYIVDYIVQNTVGALIAGKTPGEIAALRFADPACGSGSFLVGAYQHLLNYHLDYYRSGKNAKAALKAERLYERARGAYKLTIAEKQRILQNNIYGVDIDSQAVEVTKLSLYLKLLESEGREAEGQLFKYSDMTLLPSLEDNIKCGNSLIGTDFYAQGDLELTEDEQFRVNCFDWEREFPAVFKSGGFDAVIGNPPYVNIANIESQFERNYYKNNFKAATNKVDLYSLFTEKCINLLKPDGVLGYIFSNSWLGTNSFMAFREMLVKKTKVTQLVKLPAGVFHDATVTTILLFFQKTVVDKNHKIALKYLSGNEFLSFDFSLPYARIYASPNFAFNFNKEVVIKIPYIKLEKLAEFSLGIKTSDDKKFISNSLINEEYYPLLRGKDTARYSYIFHNKYIWYRPDLMAKKVGAGPRHLEYFLTSKIVIKDVATSIGATLDMDNFLVTDTLNVIYHVEKYDMKFVLALLNSKLINSWFDSNFEAGLHIKINQLGEIPIPDLDLSKKTDKTAHDNLAALADKMLSLKKREHEESNPQAKTIIGRQIGAVDRQIDEAVYRLYGLSAEEIKAVEGE